MKTTVVSALHVRRLGLLIVAASLVAIALATLIPDPGLPFTEHMCLIWGYRGSLPFFRAPLPLRVLHPCGSVTPRLAHQ